MWATYDMNGVVHLIIANPGRVGKKKNCERVKCS